jgi:hypothetical protein
MKFGLLIVALSITSCAGKRVETYRDTNVTAREQNPPLYLFNVHGSKKTFLTINGKTYERVRGTPPYYLDVPELNSLFFVTEGTDGHVTFHVVDVRTKKEIAIDGDESGFGGHIGARVKPGEIGSDYIEKAEGNRIWISKRSLNWKETTVLNLDTKAVEQWETLYFNASGQVTNRSVRTNVVAAGR